jgi:hypothetical protein
MFLIMFLHMFFTAPKPQSVKPPEHRACNACTRPIPPPGGYRRF